MKSTMIRRVAAALVGAKLLLFGAAAFLAKFVMDELALLQFIGNTRLADYYEVVDPIKTTLSYALFAPAFLASDSVEVALVARGIGGALALVTLALVFLLARRALASSLVATLAVATLLCFSNFMEQAFRVRTDTAALPLALGSLLLLTHHSRATRLRFVSGLLLGASFLCTQKAIYFSLAVGAALLAATWNETGLRSVLRHCGTLVAGWSAAVGAYCIFFGGTDAGAVLRALLIGPSYIVGGTSAFQGLGRYVGQTLARNAVPYALTLFTLAWTLAHWRRLGFSARLLSLSAALVTLLVFAHDQPWPYVFVWAQAVLVLPAALVASEIEARAPRRLPHLAFSVMAILVLSVPRNVRYFGHSNRELFPAIREAEANLAKGEHYFDGVGMVVTRDIAGDFPGWWWDTPTLARLKRDVETGDMRVPSAVLRDQPKLWILNYRLQAAAPLVRQMMHGSYVRVSRTMALTGIEIPPSAARVPFAPGWPGRYQVFDAFGSPTDEAFAIDGGEPARVHSLSARPYDISLLAASAHRFLLPVGSRVSEKLPLTGPVPDLFAAVYDY